MGAKHGPAAIAEFQKILQHAGLSEQYNSKGKAISPISRPQMFQLSRHALQARSTLSISAVVGDE